MVRLTLIAARPRLVFDADPEAATEAPDLAADEAG
jgi:hypothetical protein